MPSPLTICPGASDGEFRGEGVSTPARLPGARSGVLRLAPRRARRIGLALPRPCIGLLIALLACGSRAETITGRGISSLPYTITNSGHYHLTQDFNHYSRTNGAAINIQLKDATNDVVLDLNDHTITATNPSQVGYGILGSATGGGTITVRNGTLRGFHTGIFLTCEGALIENLTVIGRRSSSTGYSEGIAVSGANGTVRNNRVINMDAGMGLGGYGSRVVNNDINGVNIGISLFRADQSILENNRVSDCSRGIAIAESQNALVVNSRITGTNGIGIFFNQGWGKYRDNLTSGMSTPYYNGTDAGNNQ